jgi:hypothetical protein
MLDALGLLLEAGKTVFDLLGKSNIRKDSRREKVAQYLDEIAKTIHEAAQTFKAGEVPHGSCAVMEQLALALPKTIGDFVGDAEALDLQGKLLRAHNVETFMYGIPKNNKKEREESIAHMEKAAGLFKAAAISVRASS